MSLQRRQFLAGAVTGLARLVARLCHFGKRRPDAFELRCLAACGIALGAGFLGALMLRR